MVTLPYDPQSTDQKQYCSSYYEEQFLFPRASQPHIERSCQAPPFVEYFTKRYLDLAKEKLGTDMLDTQLAYSIRFYCMGSVGMTQEWVLTDNITSAETIVQMMFASMPNSLHQIYFGRCEEITAI